MVLDEFPRQLARTRRFTLGVPRAVTISADGGRVLFLRTSGGEDPVSRLWLLDLAESEGNGDGEQLLADPTASWNVGSGEVPEAERIRRERARELASGIVAYSADEACRTVAFALDGQLWVLRRPASGQPSALPRLVPTAGPVTEPRIDPTGQRVAYVTDGALHVVDLATDVSQCSPGRSTTRSPTASPNTSRPSPCTGTGASGGRRTAVSCWPRGSTTHRSCSGGSRTPPTRTKRRARSATRPPGPPTPRSPRTCSGWTAPGPSSTGTARRSST